MKFFTKILLILAVMIILFALSDSLFNGLFNRDGYRPVTEQMKEVITETR